MCSSKDCCHFRLGFHLKHFLDQVTWEFTFICETLVVFPICGFKYFGACFVLVAYSVFSTLTCRPTLLAMISLKVVIRIWTVIKVTYFTRYCIWLGGIALFMCNGQAIISLSKSSKTCRMCLRALNDRGSLIWLQPWEGK